MFFWPRRRHPVSDEELSAYLDGELSAAGSARVDGHLESCTGCRETLDGLRAVRSALQALPQPRAPRSFALREADLRPAPARPLGALGRATPVLSGVTAVALVAFGALVSADVLTQGNGEQASPGTVLLGATTEADFGAAAPQDDAEAAADDGQEKATEPDAGEEARGEFRLQDGTPAPLPATGECPPDGPCPTEYLPYLERNEATSRTDAEPTPGLRVPVGADREAPTGGEPEAPADADTDAGPAAETDLVSDDSDARVPLRAAQAATAALALGAATALVLVWRRRAL